MQTSVKKDGYNKIYGIGNFHTHTQMFMKMYFAVLLNTSFLFNIKAIFQNVIKLLVWETIPKVRSYDINAVKSN